MRVGTVLEVSVPEGSEKIYRLVVYCGEELGKRVIFAGLKQFYSAEELIGKQIVVVVNLEPKEFFDEKGEGMLLAADEGGKPILLSTDAYINNGVIIR